VPQIESEGTAEDILQAIAKEQKTKTSFSEIPESEQPFSIPSSWKWVRLGDVCNVLDIDHKMPSKIERGIPYISPLDFYGKNGIDFENAKKISEDDFIRLSKKCLPQKGDIIFPRYGTIGVLRLIETDIKFLVSYSCATIKMRSLNIDSKYIYYILQSPFIQSDEIEKYITLIPKVLFLSNSTNFIKPIFCHNECK
jgi:type I restriction enzyme S subunit